jgi:hypothetical protein
MLHIIAHMKKKLPKQLLIIVRHKLSLSSQLVILFALDVGNACAPTTIYVIISATSFILVPFTIGQSFYVLNNNVSLCFHI